MKKVVLIYSQERKESHAVAQFLKKREGWESFTFECFHTLDEARASIADAELIVSIDMEGFQNKTLLGNYQYNIIPTKQLHIIISDAVWEQYKEMEFAINVFVYVPSVGIEDIVPDTEYENCRFYPDSFLASPEEMVDRIVKDFYRNIEINV